MKIIKFLWSLISNFTMFALKNLTSVVHFLLKVYLFCIPGDGDKYQTSC